jgi:hypothetical protein
MPFPSSTAPPIIVAPLLQSIEDWAGRITTFLYDTTSIPTKPALTTVVGPTGCETGYAYDYSSGIPRLDQINCTDGVQAFSGVLGI